jgi:hypothetical protein
MGSYVAAGGFTFDKISVGGTWYWTVRATNVQSSSQVYQVADIISPFGKLGAVDVPIPGDIVLEMASCISQLQQQLAPLLALVGATPTVYSVTLTEGDPSSLVAAVPFQNVGAFGSFLTVVSTPDSPWLSASPSTVAGLNKNDQGQVTVQINPALLLASGSPYSGHVNLQDNRTPPTVIPITVNVVVLPRPSIAVSPSTVPLSYTITGAIPGGAVAITVSNSGPPNSSLSFSASKVNNNSPWLSFVPVGGGPLAPAGSAILTFSVVPAGVPLIPGVYSEIVMISSPNASNGPVSIPVTLTVNP